MPATTIMGLFPSFTPGKALEDGSELYALARQVCSSANGIVAKPGGGQAGATPLPAAYNSVDTSGGGGTDSVVLPLALPGSAITVYNNTANTIQVFGQITNPNNTGGAGDTIAAANSTSQIATGTGIALATATMAEFVCMTPGQWKRMT